MCRWRHKRREQELERELRSDPELETEEQEAEGCRLKKRGTPPGELSGGNISLPIAVNGHAAGQNEIPFNAVSRRFFETMGTPVVLGRELTARDVASAPRVAVVNEAFSKQYLGTQNPIGQRLTIGGMKQEFEIVGVVKDTIYKTLREPAPATLYVPLVQRIGGEGFGVVFEVRAIGSLAKVAGLLRTTFPGGPSWSAS